MENVVGLSRMLRYVVFFMVVLVVFTIAVVFAAINPAPMALDLAFATLEMQTSLALITFMTAGWLFGLLCAGFLVLRLFSEKRKLRKALELAEAEVRSLRSMPMQDAD
jgi:uncharacterized membrane protein YciS (DUF1049 family)